MGWKTSTRILIVLPFLTAAAAWAQSSGAGNATPDALPPLQTVTSTSLESIDELYKAMGSTRPIQPQTSHTSYGIELQPRLNPIDQARSAFVTYPSVRLVDFELDIVNQFITGTGNFAQDHTPPERRAIIVLRYQFKDPKAVETLLRAKEAKIHSAVLITDGPSTIDKTKVTFGQTVVNGVATPDNFTNDIRPDAILENTSQGKNAKALLDGGYALTSPTFNAQTVASKDQILQPGKFLLAMSAPSQGLGITPIMHEKEIFLVTLKDASQPVSQNNIEAMTVVHGTGNWENNHVNRDFITPENLRDPNGIGRLALEHALGTLQTFAGQGQTARISDIPSPGRLLVVAKDGTSIEQAYTDGRYELNTRIVQFLNNIAQNPSRYRIDEIVLSHFVSTNRAVLQAAAAAWDAMNKQGRPFRINGVLDQQFVELEGFGVSATLKGFDIRSTTGYFTKGLPEDFTKWVKLYASFEEIPGAQNIDLHGEPVHRVLWHDKTTWIHWSALDEKGQTVGEPMVDLWTGSYNNSTNRSNLERQDQLHLKASSPLAIAIRDSIRGAQGDVIRRKVAAPLETAVYITALDGFLGQSPMDIDWKVAEEFGAFTKGLTAWDEAASNRLAEIIGRAAPRASRLIAKQQVSAAQIQERLAAVKKFWDWNAKSANPLALRSSNFLHVLLSTTQAPEGAAMVLGGLFARSGMAPEELTARVTEVFGVMNRGPLPTNINLGRLIYTPPAPAAGRACEGVYSH